MNVSVQSSPLQTGNICKASNQDNLITFFDEITTKLSKAAMDCENIIMKDDFNTDLKNKIDFDRLDTSATLVV